MAWTGSVNASRAVVPCAPSSGPSGSEAQPESTRRPTARRARQEGGIASPTRKDSLCHLRSSDSAEPTGFSESTLAPAEDQNPLNPGRFVESASEAVRPDRLRLHQIQVPDGQDQGPGAVGDAGKLRRE